MASTKSESSVKSIKHAIVERTNSFIVIMVSVSVFILVLSFFVSRSFISQATYQHRVTGKKVDALNTLKANRQAADSLKEKYTAFATNQINVLGGVKDDSGPLGGENPKIILDALPSEYDYPALSVSIEKILRDGSYIIETLGGSEATAGAESVVPAATSQSSTTDAASGTPVVTPIEIPYPMTVGGNATQMKDLFTTLERSIRPMRVNSFTITKNSGNLSAAIDMTTYYLPATGLTITTETVQ